MTTWVAADDVLVHRMREHRLHGRKQFAFVRQQRRQPDARRPLVLLHRRLIGIVDAHRFERLPGAPHCNQCFDLFLAGHRGSYCGMRSIAPGFAVESSARSPWQLSPHRNRGPR
jgi:hypothetical protein